MERGKKNAFTRRIVDNEAGRRSSDGWEQVEELVYDMVEVIPGISRRCTRYA